MDAKIVQEGITFDDVLLLPRASDVTPDRADTSTRLTRSIRINIPIVSAPMDTVTEAGLAIALAQEGGLGIVHRNMRPQREAREVATVKRSENGVISDPVVLAPEETASRATELMKEHRVSGFPVTLDGDRRGKVVGILTTRDMRFLHGDPASTRVGEIMTGKNLVTAPPETTLAEAEGILNRSRVEKLLLVDGEGRLSGMITMRDIDNLRRHPHACRDDRGRLRVGGAVGVLAPERVEALLEAEADVLVVDTAHGHGQNVLETVRWIKSRANIEVIAGNVATADGARALIDAGVDAIKVGIGPGSICTTRIVTGVGVPQVTAIMNVVPIAEAAGVPVIADGGIRQSGDIAKAIAAGASTVMLGGLFAGLDESPGELVLHRGRRFKAYRGMGSEGAMAAGSADRYGQGGTRKFVPEGVEGRVPYRGPLSEFVYQMVGGLRSAMGYCGAATIDEFRRVAQFVRVSAASVVESHPHDIVITRESPNYTVAAVEE
jgi:IMP dehydrogenase